MRTIPEHRVRQMLAAEVEAAGGQTALAKKWKVSQTYISQALRGKQRIGEKLCTHLNVLREDWGPVYYDLSKP